MDLRKTAAAFLAAWTLVASCGRLAFANGPVPHSHQHEGVAEKFPEHPAVGEDAPDFRLRDLGGRWIGLGEYLGRGYLVLLFCSVSSPSFRKTVLQMDRLAKNWERLEVKVVAVYTREAHPAALRKKAPRSYRERAALARRAWADLKLKIPVLIDEWEDPVHRAYGAMPGSAFLLDSHGKIVSRHLQASAYSMEKELQRQLRVTVPPE
jgi:AhpC/TSA family protein